jgi:hypothetical protein
MTEIKPFIKCVDFWPVQIQPEKLAAYKQLIEEGQILKHHVIVNGRSGSTSVEYYAIAPHEWILEQLKERSKACDGR